MNSTDISLAGNTEPFLVPLIVCVLLLAAAVYFIFHDIYECSDPVNTVLIRLSVIVNYWPLLILTGLLYCAIHGCCSIWNFCSSRIKTVIIARPLDKVP